MGFEKDLPPGEELVARFRPFLEHLVSSDLSPKTIQRHVDKLWLLGGEIIRDLNQDPSLRKLPADRLLQSVIGDDGGPLITARRRSKARSTPPAASCSASLLYTVRPSLRRGKRGRNLA
jgi:hypothetical protein